MAGASHSRHSFTALVEPGSQIIRLAARTAVGDRDDNGPVSHICRVILIMPDAAQGVILRHRPAANFVFACNDEISSQSKLGSAPDALKQIQELVWIARLDS